MRARGRTFHSKKEFRRFQELELLEKAGKIEHLQLQVSIDLMGQDGPILTPTGRVMRYVADFCYYDRERDIVVFEDAKGHQTEVFKIKRAILGAMGIGIVLT